MKKDEFNRPKVLISSLMMAEDPERFRQQLREYDVEFLTSGQFLTEQELLDYLKTNGPIDGWISGDDEITGQVLEEASPKLKVISKWGSGMDSIDLKKANEMGVAVSNSPGNISTAVAEVALSYGISLLRGLGLQDHEIRKGKWIKPTGQNLEGAQVGILGFGRIGQKLESMLTFLGAKVLVSDPGYPDVSVDFFDMLSAIQVLFLCAPLTVETKGIICDSSLAKMTQGTFLVNVSRGPLVIEKDLVRALESGRVGGAALDVFEVEPIASTSPLLGRSNVLLGCHNANNSSQALESVHFEACANVVASLSIGSKK